MHLPARLPQGIRPSPLHAEQALRSLSRHEVGDPSSRRRRQFFCSRRLAGRSHPTRRSRTACLLQCRAKGPGCARMTALLATIQRRHRLSRREEEARPLPLTIVIFHYRTAKRHRTSKLFLRQGLRMPATSWIMMWGRSSRLRIERFTGVALVLWASMKSFSGVSDGAFSSCLSAGVPAADGRVGPIRANA